LEVTLKLFIKMPLGSILVPAAACVMLAVTMGGSPAWVLFTCAATALIASVLVAVHHAEVIAHRVGEPFGGPEPAAAFSWTAWIAVYG